MTTKKRHTRKANVLGLGGKYYNSVSNSNSVDSVDKAIKTGFETLGIPNTDKYTKTQDKWIAVGVIGIFATVLLGFTAVKGRLN